LKTPYAYTTFDERNSIIIIIIIIELSLSSSGICSEIF